MNSALLNKYVNNWVALSPDRQRVLAFAKTVKSLLTKLKGKDTGKDNILHFVLPNDGTYAP